MKMIILRHAEAVDIAQTDGSDKDRRLTPRGENQARLAGQVLMRMGLSPKTIWSSPYPRASQTARIAAGLWREEKAVQTLALLEPGTNAARIIKQIESAAPEPPLMLVGHNPDLEELLEWLIAPSGPVRVKLGKGAIAVIETGEPLGRGCATLTALWPSGQMKALYSD